MFSPAEIGERIATQDNAITADPIFMVQELARVYGIDTDCDPSIAWIHLDEPVEVDPAEAADLERQFQETRQEPEGYTRAGYHEYWRNEQPFFTRAAAEHYIRSNSYNHSGKLRIYVESAHRNPEWRAIRELLTTAIDQQQLAAQRQQIEAALEPFAKAFRSQIPEGGTYVPGNSLAIERHMAAHVFVEDLRRAMASLAELRKTSQESTR